MKRFSGSSVVIRHCRAEPLRRISSWGGTPLSGVPILAPVAMRICALTMSMPVTTSVTVCSTCRRGLTSMKKNRPESASMRNSTVPALR
jgi:ribosomal protein L34E